MVIASSTRGFTTPRAATPTVINPYPGPPGQDEKGSLRSPSVDELLQASLRQLFRYHRLALAESLLERGTEGYRLMMYTEWRRRYEDPSSGLDRLLEPTTESLQRLTPERDLGRLIESLAEIAVLLGKMTGIPVKAE